MQNILSRTRFPGYSYLIVVLWYLFTNAAYAQETTSLRHLLDEMEEIALALEKSPVIKQEFQALQETHGLSTNEETYRDFVRVRMVFEATRDSGLWQIRWGVTDQEPNSDMIWKQWRNQTNPEFETIAQARPTALGECDELSALFAVFAREMGVKSVGLFWPTWNHTVAVWSAEGEDGNIVRIVIPTSQIYLSRTASLGTEEFDPYSQKTIYNYERSDVEISDTIPAPLAKMMLQQLRSFGGNSASELQTRRNQLSAQFGGS